MLNHSQKPHTNELGAQPYGHGQFWSRVDGPCPKACTALQFNVEKNSLVPLLHNGATATTTKLSGMAPQMSLEWEWK